MEKPEYFIVKPSVKLFGGIKVTKETEFETYNDDKTVHQTLKNLVLTTKVRKKIDYNGIKTKEESKVTIKLPEEIVLIWGEEEGYIIPNYQMVKVDEAIENLKKISDITKPIENNKEE